MQPGASSRSTPMLCRVGFERRLIPEASSGRCSGNGAGPAPDPARGSGGIGLALCRLSPPAALFETVWAEFGAILA